MKKALFLRELRRLLPYGLIGPLLALALVVVVGTRSSTLILGLIPALLGITAVAPDTSSGATAFLARMPIGQTRVLAIKVLAALCWLAFGGLIAALAMHGIGRGFRDGAGLVLAFQVFAFGSGLLASVATYRTMPAILLTPALAVVISIVTLALPALLFGIWGTQTLATAMFASLGAASVVVAFLAYARGERHLKSPRPALLVIGGLVPVLLLWTTGLGAAQVLTADHVASGLTVVPGTVGSAEHLAVPLKGRSWMGDEESIVVFDRTGGAPWVVPARRVRAPEFSPDGRWLLLRNTRSRGGVLVDVRARRLESLDHSMSKEGFGFRWVVWREAGPLLVNQRDEMLVVFDPRAGWIQGTVLPRAYTVVGVDPRGRLVVWDERGLHAFTRLASWPAPAPSARPVPPPVRRRLRGGLPKTYRVDAAALGAVLRVETLLPWPHELVKTVSALHADLVLSSSGRYVLTRPRDGDTSVWVYDLRQPRRITIPGLARGKTATRIPDEVLRTFGPYVYGFGPNDRHLLLERGGEIALVDLAAGTTRTFTQERVSALGIPVAWSPDGQVATMPSGVVVDVQRGLLEPGPEVACYLTRERTILRGSPLRVRAKGVAASPLGGGQ